MPQPNKIPKAFAASGDRNIIPESTGKLGLASWNEGFPAITSVPFSEGGIAPKRADFNGIFNALSVAVLWYQQGGVFVYDKATNYEIGNLVIYSGEIYVCKTANGPASTLHSPANDTAETYWGRIYPQNGTFDRMFFSQSSGSYTAPRTGVYRITLKGGGGGGGGAQTDTYATGGGGGEGGTIIFYATLKKNQPYAYIIGAGGAAGNNGASNTEATNGETGGTTSFIVDDVTYSVTGGDGGLRRFSNGTGGRGGRAKTPNNNTVYLIPGAKGGNGVYSAGLVAGYIGTSPIGGGAGVSIHTYQSLYGGGGNGGGPTSSNMSNIFEPTTGGNGYILIEYAS